jgi:hypothetical protein
VRIYIPNPDKKKFNTHDPGTYRRVLYVQEMTIML